MNCPENQYIFFKPRWGWGGVEILAVKKSKVREMSWTAQKIHKNSKPGGEVG